MTISLIMPLAASLLALLSMAVFALRGARRDADAVSKNAQFLGGVGDFILHWFLWVVSPLATLSVRLGLGADFYNFAGLAWGAVSGGAIAYGQVELGGWALVLSGVCDIMDGRIARITKTTSEYGAFVDSILDRFIELFVFVGFAVHLRTSTLAVISAMVALGGSILVSYARAMGESLGVVCTGGLMQRGERLTIVCVACLSDAAISALLGRPPGAVIIAMLILIAASSLITAVQRSFWIAGRLRTTSAKPVLHND